MTGSEVQACIQAVDGVEALFLEELFLTTEAPGLNPRLPINMEAWRVQVGQPARLLTVNPTGITLTEMTPMSLTAEKLYRLLPAIYRIRDAEKGGSLKAF